MLLLFINEKDFDFPKNFETLKEDEADEEEEELEEVSSKVETGLRVVYPRGVVGFSSSSSVLGLTVMKVRIFYFAKNLIIINNYLFETNVAPVIFLKIYSWGYSRCLW